jgi:hypothetical protein
MSLVVPEYPEPRYTGDTGEVSATMRKADAPAEYEESNRALEIEKLLEQCP